MTSTIQVSRQRKIEECDSPPCGTIPVSGLDSQSIRALVYTFHYTLTIGVDSEYLPLDECKCYILEDSALQYGIIPVLTF